MHINFVRPVLCAVLLTFGSGAVLTGCVSAATRQSDADAEYYRAGMQDLGNELWLEAAANFTDLKARYPYSRYAALAELRLADVKFGSEKFGEAVDAYRMFSQYHPAHAEVPYAQFRQALSHLKLMPEDSIFLPPAHEKDLLEAEKASRGFREFIEHYPDHELIKDAQARHSECQLLLAKHGLYVARFYKQREKWRGAVDRYETVRPLVEGTSTEPEVLVEMVESYVRLGEANLAKARAADLQKKFAGSSQTAEAERWLKELR